MDVSVERYKRKKYMGKKDSPELYYLRQKTGTARILSTREVVDEIQENTALTKGDVSHSVEALVSVIRKQLTQGNKVRLDGLGLFHMTITCDGNEVEDKCTVKNIRRVNLRFVPDKEIKLVNASHISTRSPNAINFALWKPDDGSNNGGSGDGGEVIDPME
ncbi:HU family DNA-binding protein [Bacteroides sp.]